MERITQKDERGYYLIRDGIYSNWGLPEKFRGDDIDRLAAYEDTGLEPEDIIELKARMEREKVNKCSLFDIDFAKIIEDAFGIPVDRLYELASAEREGRCFVLPCKIFDKIWNVAAHYQFEVTEIDLLPYGNILFRCGNKGTDDYAAFYGDELGDTFTFEEPQERDNCVVKEAALRKEQDGE